MAAPAFDNTKPDFANSVDTDVDAIRDNSEWLMIAAAGAGYMLPGWATTATSPPEYTQIEMVKGTRKMKWVFTWSGGKPTQIVWQFDRGLGAGYETLSLGTITVNYDGNGNFTGTAVA